MGRTAKSVDGLSDPIDVEAGFRLWCARRAVGMTQRELAVAAEVSYQQLQKYERGENRMGASTLIRFAEALHVPPSSLLPDPDEEHAALRPMMAMLVVVEGAAELVECYAQAPERLRETIMRVARDFASSDDESRRSALPTQDPPGGSSGAPR